MNLGFTLLKKYIGGKVVYSSLKSSHNDEKSKKKNHKPAIVLIKYTLCLALLYTGENG